MSIEDKLREVLDYDPVAGTLVWKVDVGKRIKRGQNVGNLAGNSRLYLQVDGERFLAHRVVWFLFHGRWPIENLSAKDEDYTNLKIDNFVELSALETAQKGGGKSPGVSGVRGVAWDKGRQRWTVKIVHGYDQIYIGRYADLEEAKTAYAEAIKMRGLCEKKLSEKPSARKAAVNVRLRAKQRIVWARVQKHAAGITG